MVIYIISKTLPYKGNRCLPVKYQKNIISKRLPHMLIPAREFLNSFKKK